MKPFALVILACLALGTRPISAAVAAARPNILWLIVEDVCGDFGCYGNTDARTPNLDRLARESRLYRQAFATAPICSASRSAFMTGRYQTSFGAHNHRSHRADGFKRPDDVRLITERLREAGYFTANVRELPAALGFKGTGKTDWNFAHDGKAFDSDQWSDLKAHQPFYSQVNFSQTHRRYQKAERNPTDPAKIKLPPYLADDPIIRDDWAAYLDELASLDEKVGALLELIDREGLRENTVLFLFGDNGREDFRGKYYPFEQGFRVPLIVRWPALLPPGSTSDDLVSLLDVHATSLALAGVRAEGLDGWPFFGPGAKRREFVFGARDRIDESSDRVRIVRDARFKYVRNFHPERPYLPPMPYIEVTNPTYNRMRQLFAQGALNSAQEKFMAPRRPKEELYDLTADPVELDNLAAAPMHHGTLERLRAKLDAWIKETRDHGETPEDPAVVEQQLSGRAQRFERIRKEMGLDQPDNGSRTKAR
jgi:N-sulfoglucosamine sulfohydrolase